jgi:uncharacterized protein YjdB
LYVGSSQQITATVLPADANYISSLEWKSSNEKVATVSNGNIVGVGKGTATITCTSLDGSNIVQSCTVTVKQQVNSITLNKTDVTLKKGKTFKLTSKVLPANSNSKSVKWESSDKSVVKVSAKGVITAVSRGSATITCTSKDGYNAVARCNVTVVQPVTSIKLDKKAVTVFVGNTYNLSATIKPDNANDVSVSWKSSNKKVATVDANGNITAKKKGKATITCTAKDGSKKKATCKVTVSYPVTKISLNKTDVTLKKGKTVKLKAKVGPAKAGNKKVTWTTSDKKIATVTANGVVKAKKAGTVTITCTAKDGSGVYATATITVNK